MIKKLALLAILTCMTVTANAGLHVFTEHQVVYMTQHGVNKNIDVPFPTGDYPYIGQVGLKYKFKNISYSLAYMHRSNVDISGEDEYNYNGITAGVELTSNCLIAC